MSQNQTQTAPMFTGIDNQRFSGVRSQTERLISNLTPNDQSVQSIPDASPAKWHRAHTTWFFEQFVLRSFMRDYQTFNPEFDYLFNSYYVSVGPQLPQPMRGTLCNAEVDEIGEYRKHIDAAMARLLESQSEELATIVEVGLQHEQQHQELLVTDTLHAFANNQVASVMLPDWQEPVDDRGPSQFIALPGGLVEIGHNGRGFCFDNEMPRHRVFLEPYRLASRVVCNAEWLEFMADDGYQTPALWMSDGWAVASKNEWSSPLHWREIDGKWYQASPNGMTPLVLDAPVRHISWYEADAYARWAGARLPTEAEWEAAATSPAMREMSGSVWQWTASSYSPYPGFRPASGSLGEYNGKFMINQMVLRGGSSVTPPQHTRSTYRNFFHPDRRWQFTGVRLALDI